MANQNQQKAPDLVPINGSTNVYVGQRYVPKFYDDGTEQHGATWDKTKVYEPLTIVLWEGDSYTSRTFVPAGVEITDTQYWLETGNFNAQLESVSNNITNVTNQLKNFRINAKTYGAVGDGVHDDYSALSAALETGEPIYIPEGEYYISQPITINQSCYCDGTLIYSGEGAVILETGICDIYIYRIKQSAYNMSGYGIKITGNNELARNPALCMHVGFAEILGCDIGIWMCAGISGIQNVRITDGRINANTGILLQDSATSHVNANHFENIYVWGGTAVKTVKTVNPVQLYYDANTFMLCDFENLSGKWADLIDCRNFTFFNCRMIKAENPNIETKAFVVNNSAWITIYSDVGIDLTMLECKDAFSNIVCYNKITYDGKTCGNLAMVKNDHISQGSPINSYVNVFTASGGVAMEYDLDSIIVSNTAECTLNITTTKFGVVNNRSLGYPKMRIYHTTENKVNLSFPNGPSTSFMDKGIYDVFLIDGSFRVFKIAYT